MSHRDSYQLGIHYRAAATPRVPVPIGLRSVGHYRVTPPWRQDHLNKPFLQVFWGLTGTGGLTIAGREYTLQADHAALYLPGMSHHIHTRDETWEYLWFTMDGVALDQIIESLALRPTLYHVGPAPVEKFLTLQREVQDTSLPAEFRASAVGYELLTLIAGGAKRVTDSRMDRARNIIEKRYNDPDFGVDQLAGELAMNRSSLSRRFSAVYGVSPVVYLTDQRLQRALALLRDTDIAIARIATDCGYRDQGYFARVMHQRLGAPPRDIRRAARG